MKRGLAAAALVALALTASLAVPLDPVPPPPEAPVVLDRHGYELARAGTPGLAHGTPVEALPWNVEVALLAAEDHRFRAHPGVDPVAVARALQANVTAGEVVEGGSTITQQLVRTVWSRPAGWGGKLWEAWTALRWEIRADKDTILLEYSNRLYFGRSAYGVSAAAHTFFDKSPETLSLSEAAMLAAKPRSPASTDPFDHPTAARDARDRVLERIHELGLADTTDALATQLEPRHGTVWRDAPHFVRTLDVGPGTTRTTLDLDLQADVQDIVRAQLGLLEDRNVQQAAVLVVERRTAAVRAWVGSAGWTTDAGQVDGVLARRSPGSALKPFVYALALDEGGLTLASMVDDLPGSWPTTHGTYRPRNYDETFYGPLRVREALATSRNVPAVRMTELVGVAELHKLLKQLGFGLDERPDHYGLALSLGDAEVSLYELVRAYLALASHGGVRGLHVVPDTPTDAGEQVITAPTAALILDALDDPDARARAFGVDSALEPAFPMAAKTGTSVGWRDNWAVGVTPEHVIGVWVGNFDNSPMADVSGVTGAGPILRQVAERAYTGERTELVQHHLERRRICPDSGELRGATCPNGMPEWFAPGTAPTTRCTHQLDEGVRILSPDAASTYHVTDGVLPLRALAPEGVELEWRVDGQLAGRGREVRWPAWPGTHRVVLEVDGEPLPSRTIHVSESSE